MTLATWVHLEDITLRETSQSREGKSCMTAPTRLQVVETESQMVGLWRGRDNGAAGDRREVGRDNVEENGTWKTTTF